MKFITRKHLPRRTFLRAAGVTVGLPLLDAMVPALTPLARAAAAVPPKRFVGVWHPHGVAPGYWSPTTVGRDFEFSYVTKPLEKLRDYVTLISGLAITVPDNAFEFFTAVRIASWATHCTSRSIVNLTVLPFTASEVIF